MTEKRPGSKENLNWKINYLAAQVGEKTHIKAAKVAASRARYQSHHNQDTEALKQELYTARKLKLESKLHQVRRELKTALKKAKTAETQKQIKKIKTARKSLEEEEKKVTAQDVEHYEKDLEIIKTFELDLLVEKIIKSKLQKNSTLKSQELIKELIQQLKLPTTIDQTTQNIESRLISNSAVSSEITTMIHAFEAIMFGDQDKIEKQKAEEEKRKKAEENRKRKAEEKEKEQKKRKTQGGVESEFITLDGNDSSDEEQDEEFKKIYEGKKKPNRAGQQQRRKKWEEMYGRQANHVASAYKKREEKRLADPNYRPKKKKPTPKPDQAKKPMPAAATAEPVHPSWEAKRLQEEMMSKALSGKAPAANNKIVFDDSD
ncbi:hypothetical protein BD560DRAFT_392845 [Blakeslea trispora]|nr:hypothetical protein BD560DRAFT_392845 [Blakeslea trispora]